MTSVARKFTTTIPGERVVGYVRLGEGDPMRVVELAAEVRAFAERHSLIMSTVFMERDGLLPALKRPAFRALLDVVRYLGPSGLVIPTTWHLSSGESELTALLHRLAELNCRVFTTHTAKAAVAVSVKPARQ
jgi:hypothetical protein